MPVTTTVQRPLSSSCCAVYSISTRILPVFRLRIARNQSEAPLHGPEVVGFAEDWAVSSAMIVSAPTILQCAI